MLKRRSRPRKSASGRRLRGCKQSTLNLMKRKLEAAVRMAVRTGIQLEELSSLAALLHPDRSEAIIDAYWRAHGEQPGSYTIELATLFLDLARSETELDGEALARLEDMRALLEEHRRSGLTDKNMTLIRQVLATDTWSKVVGIASSYSGRGQCVSQNAADQIGRVCPTRHRHHPVDDGARARPEPCDNPNRSQSYPPQRSGRAISPDLCCQ